MSERNGFRPWFTRPHEGRIVLGVCEGLAQTLGIDVTLLRLGFLLLTFASGIGLLVYLLLWLVTPAAGSMGAPGIGGMMQQNLRGIADELRGLGPSLAAIWERTEASDWPRPLNRRWIAIGSIAVGGLLLLNSCGFFAWLSTGRTIGIAAIVLGASVLLSLAPRRRE